MDCRTCPALKHQTGVFARYTCCYTGGQICAEDLPNKLCALTLFGEDGRTVHAHEQLAILRQVREHGELDDLLKRYTGAQRDALRGMMLAGA